MRGPSQGRGRLRAGRLLPLAVLLAAGRPAAALDPERPVSENVQTVWTSRDGLPGDTMTDVFQDARKYVWIASFNGVVRFDGARFRDFSHGTRAEETVRSAIAFAQTGDGTLWIGTNGDGLVRYAGGRFSALTGKDGLPNDVVRSLAIDRSGALLAATNRGLGRVDRAGTVTTPFAEQLGKAPVETVHVDRKGTLWASVRNGPLYAAHEGAARLEEVALPGAGGVLALAEDREGALWIGTGRGGLFRRTETAVADLTGLVALGGRAVNSVTEDRHGALWLGTDAGVLRLFQGRVSRFDAANGFQGEQANRIREDHEGNVWIATSRGGVTKLSEGKFLSLTSRQGLVNDTVNGVLRARDGSFWVATDRGLSVVRDRAVVDHPASRAVGDERVRHVFEDRAGRVWISTYGDRAVLVWDGGKLRSIGPADGLTGNRCRQVLEDSAGAVWIATANGLNRLEGGRIRSYTRRDGLADDYVLFVFEDTARTLWFGTNGGGLYRLAGERLERFGKADGLGSDIVFSLLEDSRRELWATTTSGVSLFRNGRFHTFGPSQGLRGNAVFQMLDDGAGRFWLRADVGLFAARADEMRTLDRGELRSPALRLFDSKDGLPGAPTPASWACRAPDGALWLPTLKGVAIIDPGRIAENRIPPPVYVEEVVVDGRAVPPGELRELAPGTRRVTFRYTGLSYQVPERVSFRVVLDGFDAGWSEASPRREATYTSLPPGSYTFRVKACNNDGVWSSEGASVSFLQPEPFYQSVPFFALAALGLAGAGAGLTAFRSRHLRRRKAELERLVEARTEEVVRKNLLLEERQRELERSQELIREANLSLEKLSRTDGLTGLANRRHVEEELDREWGRHLRDGRPLAVLMLDVDCFKPFNDRYGHQAGDACLRQVARALAAAVRDRVDVPGRYGGEEFIVVMPGSHLEGALRAAERIRRQVEALAVPHDRSTCARVVTVSLGAASTVPDRETSPEALIRAADAALYLSKQTGRNRVSAPPDGVRAAIAPAGGPPEVP